MVKGDPLSEVTDLKERLQASEDALRKERRKYASLRKDHEEILKASTIFETK